MPGKILSIKEALSHPLRRRIVVTLMEDPGISVRQLARHLGVGVGALSGHLSILHRMGLIREERQGNRLQLFLNEEYIANMLGERWSGWSSYSRSQRR